MALKFEIDEPADIKMLRFPKSLDRRMTHLLDLNNEGKVTAAERKELEGLVEVSQLLSLLRLNAERVMACR